MHIFCKTTAILALTGIAVPSLSILATPAAARVQHLNESASVAEARRHLAAGRLPDAMIAVKNALQRDPEDAAARYLFGKVLLEQGDLPGAELALTRARAMAPSDETAIALAQTKLRMGDAEAALAIVSADGLTDDATMRRLAVRAAALFALDRAEEATVTFRRALEIDPAHVESQYGLAQVYAGQNDFAKARAALEKLLAQNPDFTRGWMLHAEVASIAGDLQAARVSFDRAVAASPESAEALLSRARFYLATEDYERARADLTAAQAVAPGAPLTQYLKAAIAFAEGDVQAANNAYTQVRDTLDTFPPAVFLGAAIKQARGEYSQADVLLVRFLDMEPGNYPARRTLAQIRMNDGQPRSALEILTPIMEEARDDLVGLRILSSAYVALNDAPNAKKTLLRLVDRGEARDIRVAASVLRQTSEPAEVIAILQRGLAAHQDQYMAADLFMMRRVAGQEDMAFSELADWIGKHPESSVALMVFANGLLETGRKDAAARVYRAVLDMEPTNAVVLNNYAWLLHGRRDAEALGYARRAYDAAGDAPDIADTYGWMHVNYGKLSKGITVLEKARQAAPGNTGIQYHFAYALSEAGRRSEARSVLSELLDGDAVFEQRAEAQQLMQSLNGG